MARDDRSVARIASAWPTLVLLRDGMEAGRVLRPENREIVDRLVENATPASTA
jgi:hypothetical protein